MSIPLRSLGRTGLSVSAEGLGCMGMSFAYGATDDDESTRTIHRALDLGVTFLDTSDMYGPFTNEQLVGRAIKTRRDEVTVATKFGIQRSATDPTKRSVRGDAAYVREACDASLGRLGIDTIDLYYVHRTDPKTPIEETITALAELVAQGDDVAPIPGTKRVSYLEENAGSVDVELSTADLAAIDAAFPKDVAAGARYPDMSAIEPLTPKGPLSPKEVA